jgi:tetratricopeptide (TPR) repeat protein
MRPRREWWRNVVGAPLGYIAVGIAAFACSGSHGSNRAVAARSPFAVADSLRFEGRTSQALPIYQTLRDSFAAAHDTANWWRAELWSGYAFVEAGQRDSARQALALAGALARGDSSRAGWTLYVHSIFLDRQGIFDSAFADATRAQILGRHSGDRMLEASATHALGRIHSLTGHYREALANNMAALVLERAAAGDTSRAAVGELNELGID